MRYVEQGSLCNQISRLAYPMRGNNHMGMSVEDITRLIYNLSRPIKANTSTEKSAFWMETENSEYFECSNCGKYIAKWQIPEFKYCSYCGRFMEK